MILLSFAPRPPSSLRDPALSLQRQDAIAERDLIRGCALFDESYRLIAAPDSLFGDRDQVTWKEVSRVPLCLLTPDMQNRRIM